jgi:hypothetical protein
LGLADDGVYVVGERVYLSTLTRALRTFVILYGLLGTAAGDGEVSTSHAGCARVRASVSLAVNDLVARSRRGKAAADTSFRLSMSSCGGDLTRIHLRWLSFSPFVHRRSAAWTVLIRATLLLASSLLAAAAYSAEYIAPSVQRHPTPPTGCKAGAASAA